MFLLRYRLVLIRKLLLATSLSLPFLRIFIACGAEPAPLRPAVAKGNLVENSVVKVFSQVRYPELYQPWSKRPYAEVTGSGVVIRNGWPNRLARSWRRTGMRSCKGGADLPDGAAAEEDVTNKDRETVRP